jgi:hypothetical protein
MSGAAPHPRQGLIAAWVAQMVGTIAVAVVVAAYVKARGAPFASEGFGLQRYVFTAILAATVPALYFLRAFKAKLDADALAIRERGGVPDAARRKAVLKSLAVGSALCELPMAVGALDLFFGGEMRWFVAATFITLALRLSYRPFVRDS